MFSRSKPRVLLLLGAASVSALAVAAFAAGCGSSSDDGSVFVPDGSTPNLDGAPFDGTVITTTPPDDDGGIVVGNLDGGGQVATVFDGSLAMVVRDFRFYDAGDPTTDPDFENTPKIRPDGGPIDNGDGTPIFGGDWDDPDIVTDTLGSDGKPVYATTDGGGTLTTHGKAAFDKWYNDVPGTNIHVDYPLPVSVDDGGAYVYDSNISGQLYGYDPNSTARGFFPIDDGTPYATAFGNEPYKGQAQIHNFSFTTELHTVFTYQGGEYFTFRGDDDVFVFIDNKRVINLGGIHNPLDTSVYADDLNLVKGQDYPLDFFSAERHLNGSNILFTTTLELRPAPGIR